MRRINMLLTVLVVVLFMGACEGFKKEAPDPEPSPEAYMENYNRVVGAQTIWGVYDGIDMRTGGSCILKIKKNGTGYVKYDDAKIEFEWERTPGSDPDDQFDQRFIIYINGHPISDAKVAFTGLIIDSSSIKGAYLRQK